MVVRIIWFFLYLRVPNDQADLDYPCSNYFLQAIFQWKGLIIYNQIPQSFYMERMAFMGYQLNLNVSNLCLQMMCIPEQR